MTILSTWMLYTHTHSQPPTNPHKMCRWRYYLHGCCTHTHVHNHLQTHTKCVMTILSTWMLYTHTHSQPPTNPHKMCRWGYYLHGCCTHTHIHNHLQTHTKCVDDNIIYTDSAHSLFCASQSGNQPPSIQSTSSSVLITNFPNSHIPPPPSPQSLKKEGRGWKNNNNNPSQHAQQQSTTCTHWPGLALCFSLLNVIEIESDWNGNKEDSSQLY